MDILDNTPTQMTQTTSISKASTLDKIADFWDTHSAADYWDRMVEVKMTIDPVARRLTTPPPENPTHAS